MPLDYKALKIFPKFSLRKSQKFLTLIIYTWKVLEGMVSNYSISNTTSERMGRERTLAAPKGRTAIQSLRDQSYQKAGPALFNSLPRKTGYISYQPARPACYWGTDPRYLQSDYCKTLKLA
jgi:hypothetical protein